MAQNRMLRNSNFSNIRNTNLRSTSFRKFNISCKPFHPILDYTAVSSRVGCKVILWFLSSDTKNPLIDLCESRGSTTLNEKHQSGSIFSLLSFLVCPRFFIEIVQLNFIRKLSNNEEIIPLVLYLYCAKYYA